MTRIADAPTRLPLALLIRACVVGAIGLALHACGYDAPASARWTSTIDTLASGTVLVRNPQVGAWDSASAWRLVEDLRIGAMEGQGPEVFGRVHDLEVDGYGRIYVLDSQASEIRVFDDAGQHVRTIGGPGGGPGELQRPTGFTWAPGWRLWVEDPANGRYTVYDTTGAVHASYPRTIRGVRFRWAGTFDRSGRLYVRGLRVLEQSRESVLICMDSVASPADTFLLPKYEPPTYELVRDGLTRWATTVPFAPSLVWRLAPDGSLWFGITDKYSLYHRSLDGDTLRIVERGHTPLRVTAAERDDALTADYFREMAAQGVRIDPGLVPEYKPAWLGFTLDAEGYLWVIPLLDEEETSAFDVFDPHGRYLGRLPFGIRMQAANPVPVVRGDRLYAVIQDEFGVQYVVRALVEGRDHGG